MDIRSIIGFVLLILIQIGGNKAQNDGRPIGCIKWCDVAESDYRRGWIEACQTIRTVMRKYRWCYFNYQLWRYNCIYAQRPESHVAYMCCPRFTLQYSWCVLPPRPAPTQPTHNEYPSETKQCGVSKYPNSGTRLTFIVGGFTSLPNEFPWQVSVRLGTPRSDGHLCGGAIISSTLIITAAHCAYYYKAYPQYSKFVVVGDFDRNRMEDSQATYDVVDVISYPGYDRRTVNNDIALLRLESAIRFNDDIQPICLPDKTLTYAGSAAIVSGWGSRIFGGTTARLLQFAELTVMSSYDCNSRLLRYGLKVTDQMICASDGESLRERDACQGDSGGPLAVQDPDGSYALVGLVSWGLGCAIGTPGVYTRVGEFVNWIKQFM